MEGEPDGRRCREEEEKNRREAQPVVSSVASSQPVKRLMRDVMRPRGEVSTCLTPRLSHSP